MQHLCGSVLSGSLLVDQFIEDFRVHLLSKHKLCILLLHLKVILLTDCLPHCPPGCFLLNKKEICTNGWAACLFPFCVSQFTNQVSCRSMTSVFLTSRSMMCFDVLIFLQLKDTTVSIGLVIGSETSAVFCEYVGERFDLGTFWFAPL